MMYPDWHKQALVMPAQMHVAHYKRRVSGDDIGIIGCGCRGCAAYREHERVEAAADALNDEAVPS